MDASLNTMTKDDILRMLSEHREKIQTFGVYKLALFGSFLRGTADTQSDIDILVDLKQKTFDNYMDLKFFLEDILNYNVDLVLKDALKPQIRDNIIKEAEYVPGL